MKMFPSLFIVPLLILTTGCSSYVSSGYDYDYGHHSHVSVGVHGHNSGAAVVGALIVGGIIGTIIADSKNEQANQQAQQANNSSIQSANQDELVNGYSIDNPQDEIEVSLTKDQVEENQSGTENQSNMEYQTALSDNRSNVQWYQYGKDGHCYLMGVDQGVTDVVSAVPEKKCEQ